MGSQTENQLRISDDKLCSTAQIYIPEIGYYQKVSSHAQILPQGAEKQLRKVNVVVVGVEGKDHDSYRSLAGD